VINIVTKPTSETQGVLVRADAGRAGELGSMRYGGTLGSASYRVYSQWSRRDESLIVPGTGANDPSHITTTGFRADWAGAPGALMMEGAFSAGQTRELWPNFNPQTVAADPLADVPSDSQGGHLLARWTHDRPGGGSLQIQSFFDIEDRQEPVADYGRRTFDLDTQYHTAFGARQDLVAGLGYRFSTDEYTGHIGFALTPPTDRYSRVTGFLQDEIALFDHRLAVTLGTQVQDDAEVGVGIQPTARAIWKGVPHQRFWAAVSRALRTPSLYEQRIRVDFPPVPTPGGLPVVVTVLGDPDAGTETLVDAEVGYRVEAGTANLRVTGFVGSYAGLQTREPSDPVVVLAPSPHLVVSSQFENLLNATTRGLEVTGHWSLVPEWRLDGSVTAFHVTPHPEATTGDLMAAATDGSAPALQWQLRTVVAPVSGLTLMGAVYYVGPLAQLAVDGYTRADMTAEWRFSQQLAVMITGQNLLAAAHAEFSTLSSLLLATQVPRSVSLGIRWTSR
jgi:iron complex outermembrane receptor protein